MEAKKRNNAVQHIRFSSLNQKNKPNKGFARVNQVTSASLRYPLSVFNKNSTLNTGITHIRKNVLLLLARRKERKKGHAAHPRPQICAVMKAARFPLNLIPRPVREQRLRSLTE